MSFAQVDPDIDWKVMELPHFDLIYDAKHQDLANLYADRLEDNLQFLKEYFDIFPTRVAVVLNDRTDLTNGYATPLPYQLIVLFPVLPGPQETIGDYGDWARELTMHEYTHSLSFQPRRGFVKALYYTFGNWVTPNILLPRWWLEGVAVDMETRTSAKGRLRSPYQDGAIRAYVLEDRLKYLRLAEINETSIHTWPQGGRPYLFGSLMWSELIARYGKEQIRELHRRYGGRMPYFINAPLEEETGGGYQSLFNDMRESVYEKAQSQLQVLKRQNFSQGSTLKVKNGIENFFPVISPDGLKMIFLSKGDANKRSVRILARPSLDVPFDGSQELAEIDQRFGESLRELNPTPRQLDGGIDESDHDDAPPGGTIQRIAWFPDSTKFVFDKSDTLNRYHEVSDLHFFDLTTMKVKRLTRNERAREASVSPDGKQLVFVKLGAGTTQLALYDLEKESSEIIYSPALQTRISFPVFISSDEILFSERFNGREVLKKFSFSKKTTEEVLNQYPDARYSTVTKNGLMFSSTLNGVANVYLASFDLKSARPITHTGTFISTASFDSARQEIYVSELTTQGFQIRSFPFAKEMASPLPQVQPLFADRYPSQNREVPSIAKPEPQDYSAWPWILPRYWFPDFYFSNRGSQIGGTTGGSDPLGKHVYNLGIAYETEPQETSSQFTYINNQTEATISLNAFDYRTGVINTPIRFRQQFYALDAVWEIPQIASDFYAGFGYSWIGRDYSDLNYSFSGRSFKNAETESSGPSLIANYSNITMSGAQISPEQGFQVAFRATDYLQRGTLTEEFRKYQLSYLQFFSKWLPRHHVLMLRTQGQYIDRDVSLAYMDFSMPYAPFANSISPYYLMRGYDNGQFLGKSVANYTAEYRFPIAYVYSGNGTIPFFLKRIHGALIADGLTVDGYSYYEPTETYEAVDKWKSFWTTGAELKFDVTLGYHIPMTLYFGWYSPHDSRYTSGQYFTFGLQL